MKSRLQLALTTMLAASACLVSSVAIAQIQAPTPTISGISVADADGVDAIQLIIKTLDGKPVPSDAIGLKFRDDVARVTFKGIPMAQGLGAKVPFAVGSVRHITKGYALKEHAGQSFARLKFDTPAKVAFDGWTIEPSESGSTLRIPLGDTALPGTMTFNDVPDMPTVATLGQPAAPQSATAQQVAAPAAPTATAAAAIAQIAAPEVAAKGQPSAAPPAKPAEAGGMFDWASDNPTKAAPTAKEPLAQEAKEESEPAKAETEEKTAATGTPLETRDEARGPSFGRAAGGLALVVLLILAMAFCIKKMRGIKTTMGATWRPPANGVKVLSTHRVSKGHDILIVDVLGEYLVIGQSGQSMSLLSQLPATKVHSLIQEQSIEPTGETGSILSRLMGKGTPQIPQAPIVSANSIAGLTHELAGTGIATAAPVADVRHIRPTEPAAASSDAEPKGFEELVQRRLAQAQDRLTGSSQRSSRRDPELESVAVSIRDRARAMGRL